MLRLVPGCQFQQKIIQVWIDEDPLESEVASNVAKASTLKYME